MTIETTNNNQLNITGPQPSPSHLLNTAATGSIISFSGTIAGKILSILLQIAISRLFGPKFFGLFVTCIITCQLFRIFGSLGLAKGGQRFLAIALEKKEIESLPGIFATVVIFSILPGVTSGVVLYFLSPFIAVVCFNAPEMIAVLKLFSYSIPFLILLRTVSELSRGFRTVKYSVAIEDLLFPILQITFFLLLYFGNLGFSSVAYSYIAACVLSALSIIIIVRRQIKRALIFNRLPGRLINYFFPLPWVTIIKYSLPFIPIALSLVGYNYIDVIMINFFSDAQDVGLYAAASRMGLIFSMLSLSSAKIFTPLIAAEYGAENKENIRLLYQAITRWMLYITLPIFAFILIFNNQIMLSFGRQFLEDCPLTLVILSIGHLFAALTGGVGIVLTMTNHQYKELINVMAGLTMNIFLNLFLIPRYGIVGAAMATTITRVIINTGRLLLVYKLFNMQPFGRNNLLVILVCILLYIFSYFIPNVAISIDNIVLYLYGIVAEIILIFTIYKFAFEQSDYSILQTVVHKFKRIRKTEL